MIRQHSVKSDTKMHRVWLIGLSLTSRSLQLVYWIYDVHDYIPTTTVVRLVNENIPLKCWICQIWRIRTFFSSNDENLSRMSAMSGNISKSRKWLLTQRRMTRTTWHSKVYMAVINKHWLHLHSHNKCTKIHIVITLSILDGFSKFFHCWKDN